MRVIRSGGVGSVEGLEASSRAEGEVSPASACSCATSAARIRRKTFVTRDAVASHSCWSCWKERFSSVSSRSTSVSLLCVPKLLKNTDVLLKNRRRRAPPPPRSPSDPSLSYAQITLVIVRAVEKRKNLQFIVERKGFTLTPVLAKEET